MEMPDKNDPRWNAAIALHAEAVSELVKVVESIPPELWSAADSGKWSPAHIVEHLRLAYEVLLQELSGGAGMSLRMKPWQRLILRYTVARKILRGGAFPKGARAPRETRPETFTADPNEAIAQITERARVFESAMNQKRKDDPRKHLTHAYFGHAGLEKSLTLCARHVLHHARQLGKKP